MPPKLPSRRILVTGASGFVGANLTHYLAGLGYHPHVILRRNSNIWRIRDIASRIKMHPADLENKAQVRRVVKKIRPEIIYHCAAYGGYHFQKDLGRIISANITGTVNLLEACAGAGFRCFVNTSTSSEYGIKDKPMKEKDLPEPVSAYGAAKASATLLCHQFARSKGLPVVTLRLFSPYGYFEDARRLIASVILSCMHKKAPLLSSRYSVRDFVFIDDVLRAYLKAAARIQDIAGELINIGSGRQHSVGQVVKEIINLSGSRSAPIWEAVDNPRIEPSLWVADISKARKELDWEPRFDLTSGLKKTISWFNHKAYLYHGKERS